MWLQLTGLVPMGLAERSRWKVSYQNLLPLRPEVHFYLTDGDARGAILRPTRTDLHSLVRALEAGLAQEERKAGRAVVEGRNVSGWTPDWNTLICDNWSRKVSAGSRQWMSFEYQFDFFHFEERSISSMRGDSGNHVLTEAPGSRKYPNRLQRDLETVYAPLSVLSIIAVAVSQMHFVSKSVGAEAGWQKTFMEDLDTMSYIVNVVGSASPHDFRSLKRPEVLSFDRPQTKGVALPPILRAWPRKVGLRSSSTADGDFVFSSSPPAGYETDLASRLHGLTVEHDEVEEMSSDADRRDESEGSGGAGAGEGHTGAQGESRSGSEESSSGTTSGMSQGFVDTSRQREHREGGDSPPSEHGTLPCTLKRGSDINRTELSHEDLRHAEWELLDHEQDELLHTAREALIQALQSLAMPTRPCGAKTSTMLSTFLVGSDPLAIATKLDDIERRRREIIDEWE